MASGKNTWYLLYERRAGHLNLFNLPQRISTNIMFGFKLKEKDSNTKARCGLITTAHGTVDTPAFMPVGTQATVKTMTPEDLEGMGFQMMIVNAYHLYLRPGHELVKELGGLQKFMGWNKSVATDSGGFQVLSLAKTRKILDHGISFQSHLDGSKHLLTPGKAVEIQEYLNSDIMMCLDECPPVESPRDYIEKALDLTTRWAKECKQAKTDETKALFGIVQGGIYEDLRQKSMDGLMELDFEGYSIGGLGIGEESEETYQITEFCLNTLPEDKVRYLMGIGKPTDIVEAVAKGVDLFDCVIPTRNARNGNVFTSNGKIVIKNAQYSNDNSPLDEKCGCYTCTNFSRAYLRHIFLAGELLSHRLLTLHNLYYYATLMKRIRESIVQGKFEELRREISGKENTKQ